MRQILSTALVALIVGAIAGATMGAVAQPEPAQVAPGGINADRVDGKHAVAYTNKRGVRAGKLVATNRRGMLPSNIVQPYWGYIKNKPGILADHAISWNEVQGVPGGFADGVDNEGVTQITMTRVISPVKTVANGTWVNQAANCPDGSVVTGGGFYGDSAALITDSYPLDLYGWNVFMDNDSGESKTLQAYALCLRVDPAGRLTTVARNKALVPARARK